VGICDTTSGNCGTMAVMNGQICDDMNACTVGETCSNQVCSGGTSVTACSQVGDGCCPTNCNATNDLDCAIMPSCKDIKMASPQSADGIYTIDPDGPGPITAFAVYCEMTTNGGGWTQCLSVQNTSVQDLHCMNDFDYFDPCVDFTMASWSGNEVMLQLVQNNAKVYSAWGTRNINWTYELLTSTSPPNCPNTNSQYNRQSMHPNAITLNDGYFLSISGKNSGQQGWGGSWGNGYMIVVQTTPTYAGNNVVAVMSETNSGCYSNCAARSFVGMSASHEVMYGPGGTVSTANNNALTAANAFLGEFKFFVR
jgi:hypothetical protein